MCQSLINYGDCEPSFHLGYYRKIDKHAGWKTPLEQKKQDMMELELHLYAWISYWQINDIHARVIL